MSSPTMIVLAAGQSKRMGQPKQLILHQNKPLLRHVLDEILGTGVKQVIVVLGAFHEAIAPVIAGLSVCSVVNPDWETGMAGSIQVGIGEMRRLWPESGSVMVCLADQVLLRSEHYQKLLDLAGLHPEKVIASAYEGILGVPAVFPKGHQHGLMGLAGDAGAGKWLRNIAVGVLGVDLPEAALDWDCPDDLLGLEM